MKYKEGDRVRIVSTRTNMMNNCGEMDHWLGKVMTIRLVRNRTYEMVECGRENYGFGWTWRDLDIVGLAQNGEVF